MGVLGYLTLACEIRGVNKTLAKDLRPIGVGRTGDIHVKRIQKCGAYAFAAIFVLAQAVGAVPAQSADADRWVGWAELGGALGGTHEDRAEAALFLPIVQGEKGLFFLDARGKLFEEQVSEINAAVGYRHMLPGGWNLGAWAGADRRDTSQDNIFWAASGGVEALSDNFDVRLNGYLAISDPKGSPGLASAVIEGGQVFLLGGQEVPLSGVDGEVGFRIPLEGLGIDAQRHALRAYAGGFFFDDKDAFEKVAGPKSRVEWRIHDILESIPGSLLALETEWRSDSVRGGNVEVGLRFRLPFSIFGGSAARSSDKSNQWHRMMDGLERDTDILTARSERENVEDLLTGVDFDRAVDVNSATGVTAPAAAAGSNTLLVADGSGGAIAGPQALQASQTLLGGGGSIQVRGLRSGTVATLTAPGQTPTFTNAVNTPTVTLADRTHLAGVRVTGNTINFANTGVRIGSDQFVVLQNVDIANVGLEGVLGINRNTARLINVNVSNTPNAPSVAFGNDNTVSVEGGTFDSGLFGLFFNNRNTINVTDATISNATIDGININSRNGIAISGTTFSTIGVDGIAFNNRNTISLTDSTFRNVSADAIFGNNNNVIAVSGVTATNSGQDFVDVADFNTVTVTNSMTSNLAGQSFNIDDDNVVTVTGGQYSSSLEAFDADDRNTITLTNVALSSTGGQEGIDISDNNTLVVTGSSVTVTGNRALEFTNNNNVTIDLSTLNGTPTNTVAYDGTGNVVSGSGNVDNTTPTVAFCSNLGVQTGSIGFTNGTTCP